MTNEDPRSYRSHVLLVDDQSANLDVLYELLAPEGYEISMAPNGGVALRIAAQPERMPDLILLDVQMPGLDGFEVCRRLKAEPATASIPVVFVTANDDTASLIRGFEVGAVDYVGKPFREEEVLARARTHLENSRLTAALERSNRELAARNRQLEEEAALRRLLRNQVGELAAREASGWALDGLIGNSPAMRATMEEIHRAQATMAPVLIIGEEGSGRELAARAIHSGSAHGSGPFVTLDCHDIPQDVVASIESRTRALATLYGSAESDTDGRYQLANGGTLYLRDIDALPLPIQASLLRGIESGTAKRVGDLHPMAVTVRIVVASEAPADHLVAAGALQEEMAQHLAHSVVVPALPQRREDIPELARHFAARAAAQLNRPAPAIAPAALEVLQHRDYRGNLPELRSLIEGAVVTCGGGEIRPQHLIDNDGSQRTQP